MPYNLVTHSSSFRPSTCVLGRKLRMGLGSIILPLCIFLNHHELPPITGSHLPARHFQSVRYYSPPDYVLLHCVPSRRRLDRGSVVEEHHRLSKLIRSLSVYNLQGADKRKLDRMGHKGHEQHPSLLDGSHVL